MGENLGPLNPHVQSFFEQGQAFFMQQTGDPARSQQMTLQALADLRQQQAASLAYFDVFWLFAVLSLGLVAPRAPHEALGGREGGAHRGGVGPIEWASWTVWLRQAVLFAGLYSIVRAGPADISVCADRSRFAEGDVRVREAVKGHTRRK